MKGALMLAEMLALLVAVPKTVGAHQKAQLKLTKCYAAMVQKVQSAEMQAPWPINQYLALQVKMTTRQAEIAETGPAWLGLAESLSGLA
jgi:hypothetical protein